MLSKYFITYQFNLYDFNQPCIRDNLIVTQFLHQNTLVLTLKYLVQKNQEKIKWLYYIYLK